MNPEANAKVVAHPGRPKSEEKRAGIMEAATDLFLARGLAATSMDAVAERAGVSKQTVYSHFGGKEDLYGACITKKVASYGFNETELADDVEVKTALLAIGSKFLDLIFDAQVVGMFRVVIGESAAHRGIAELFFENGPGKTIRKVARFMQNQMRRGRLRQDDPEYTAVLFLNMVRAHYQMQLLMAIEPDLDAEARARHLRKVVDQFLTLYGK
jgi:TetR/AcrR family transcriptional repressor of mexJK operon